jgi:hypothetical protein
MQLSVFFERIHAYVHAYIHTYKQTFRYNHSVVLAVGQRTMLWLMNWIITVKLLWREAWSRAARPLLSFSVRSQPAFNSSAALIIIIYCLNYHIYTYIIHTTVHIYTYVLRALVKLSVYIHTYIHTFKYSDERQ